MKAPKSSVLLPALTDGWWWCGTGDYAAVPFVARSAHQPTAANSRQELTQRHSRKQRHESSGPNARK
jgi:hypothetical protein